jgi:hypothetical protein
MRTVTDLNDATAVRCPLAVEIAPSEFPVNQATEVSEATE